MTKLIKIDTQEYPISDSEFRSRFPNTAFPQQINYSDYGYAVVFPSPQPICNYNQFIRETTPILTNKGWYEQNWEVVSFSDTMESEEYQTFETNYINNLKSQKLKQIQERKNVMRDAGFYVKVDDVDTLFDSDTSARIAYTEIAMQLQNNPEFTTMWKASSGVCVTMNATLFQSVMIAGKTHIESCFAWQANKEIEVHTANTVDEVNNITL